MRVGICPEFALHNVFEASHLDQDAEYLSFGGAGREILITPVARKLNSKLAVGRDCIDRVLMSFDDKSSLAKSYGQSRQMLGNNHNIGIQSVNGFDITVDRQAAYQAIGAERFAGCNYPRKIGSPAFGAQFVHFQRCHTFTITCAGDSRFVVPNG